VEPVCLKLLVFSLLYLFHTRRDAGMFSGPDEIAAFIFPPKQVVYRVREFITTH
jgi:hypothetical protein